ncbi:MAG: hypothetical protein GC180_12775 [Bacteroidetes bacterium]|nr:hypothetical protein [Bacteroidota bacterium]
MLKRINPFLDRYALPVFLVLLLVLLAWVGVFRFLNHDADGVHFIRQTDGLSFMMGYYQFDVPFFEPRVYNLLGADGKAAAEFPIFYYLGAQLAKVFGPAVWDLRIWFLILAGAGWFSIFQILKGLGANGAWSVMGAFISLSGLVYVYYIFGMVPDLAALGLSLLAWVFVLRAWKRESWKPLIGASVFFTLAALLKITFLIHPIALIVGFILFFPSNDFLGRWNKNQWLGRFILLGLFPVILGAAWVLYVRQYNAEFGNWYFLSEARPIWSMTAEQIRVTWQHMYDYWWSSYYHPNMWTIWMLVFAFNVYAFRKTPGFWNRLHWVFLAGCLAYLILFFRQFQDHDYYFILLYSYFVFLFLAFAINLQKLFPRINHSPWMSLFLLFLLVATYQYDANKYYGRVNGPDLFSDTVEPLRGFYQTLDSLNIPKNAAIMVMGDVTHNGSLYLMRRQGFGIHNDSKSELGIMDNMMERHPYQYALSLPGYSFGNKIEEWKMEKILDRYGVELYRIRE